MIKGIIFDMDGVIVDSLEPHFKAWVMFLKERYNHDLDYDVFLKEFNGRSGKGSLEYLRDVKGLPIEDIEKTATERGKIADKVLLNSKIPLIAGFEDLFKDLKEKNLKVALATSSATRFVEIVLKPQFDTNQFDFVVTSSDINRAKPDPEIYLKAIEGLGLKPEECLVIEDAHVGVKAAKAAGAYVIGVHSTQSKEDMHEADFLVEAVKQIELGKIIKQVQ